MTIKGVSATEVALKWAGASDDIGVTGYEVVRDGLVDARSTTGAVTLGGLTAATRRCWTIVALNAAGNRSAPSPQVCGAPLDLTPPTAPGQVRAVIDGEHAARVTWTPSSDDVGVIRYELRRDQQVIGGFDADATSASDPHLSAGHPYCYTVVAFDLAGNASGEGSPACITTPDLTPPSVPAEVAVRPSSPTQVVVAWAPSRDEVGVAGYVVRRGDAFTAAGAQTMVAESRLQPSTEYCYSVSAFDAAGNASAFSEPVCGKTAPEGTLAGPWNLRALTSSPGEVELSWAPSPEKGVAYVVYWDGRNGANARIGITRRNTFRVFGEPARARHCYRVVAEDQAEKVSPATFPVCTSAATRLSAR